MREYTDQEICQIIQDYDRIIQELRYVVEAFVRELASLDSNDDWLCRLLALQHSGTGSATTHSSLHDLSDLLKNKKFKGMEYSSELQKGINEKLEEIDGICPDSGQCERTFEYLQWLRQPERSAYPISCTENEQQFFRMYRTGIHNR